MRANRRKFASYPTNIQRLTSAVENLVTQALLANHRENVDANSEAAYPSPLATHHALAQCHCGARSVTSGWQIYNATPFLGFSIPKVITLGGWLGGAIQWHFATM